MSGAPGTKTSRRPWHLWVIGIVGGLWSSMGVISFVLTQMNVEAVMSRFPPEQRAYFESFPLWAVAFWALGVFGGVIGCLLLLLKNRLAFPVLLASAIGVAICNLGGLLLLGGMEVMRATGALGVTVFPVVFAAFLAYYARAMSKQGMLFALLIVTSGIVAFAQQASDGQPLADPECKPRIDEPAIANARGAADCRPRTVWGNTKRGQMRKIIVGAQVSMDGVMQAPGGPTEDPTKGFKFGGWSMPHFDQEFGEELDRLFNEKFDLLLGRKTYEIFAAYWPYYDEGAPHGGIAKLFKEIKKYAVSRSGGVDTSWQGSVLLRDVADVRRLRDEDGPNLVTQGSTELVHALLANDIVDAMAIFTVPVVLGSGKKLFADGSVPHAYRLTRSRVSSTGVMIGHYERDGAIKIGGTELASPSEREIARQARMKREG